MSGLQQETVQEGRIDRKNDLNEEAIFMMALRRYIRYQLGKTPNNKNRRIKPAALQHDTIMAVLQIIEQESK